MLHDRNVADATTIAFADGDAAPGHARRLLDVLKGDLHRDKGDEGFLMSNHDAGGDFPEMVAQRREYDVLYFEEKPVMAVKTDLDGEALDRYVAKEKEFHRDANKDEKLDVTESACARCPIQVYRNRSPTHFDFAYR